MAPNNKKKGGRTNNNNKKKGGNKGAGAGTLPQTTTTASSSLLTTRTAAPTMLGNITNNPLPTFHHHSIKNNNKDDGIDSSSGGGGYYAIYKRATTNFWSWMKQTLPQSKMTTVNDLRHGADAVLECNIQSLDSDGCSARSSRPTIIILPPKAVLKELSLSIQYRQLMTSSAKFAAHHVSGSSSGGGGGGDQGHKYMLEVLCYCRSVLEFGRHVAKVAIKEQKGRYPPIESSTIGVEDDDDNDHKMGTADNQHDGIGGRFNALLLDDDDDDGSVTEQEEAKKIELSIRQRDFPSFEAPPDKQNEGDEEMDIQRDLINGDDRFQALALLNTMDDLMCAVEQHYGMLFGDIVIINERLFFLSLHRQKAQSSHTFSLLFFHLY
jgi:hypothetical protein